MYKYLVINPNQGGHAGIHGFAVTDEKSLEERLGNGEIVEGDTVIEVGKRFSVIKNAPLRLQEIPLNEQ